MLPISVGSFGMGAPQLFGSKHFSQFKIPAKWVAVATE
jgi:hypothetical protein